MTAIAMSMRSLRLSHRTNDLSGAKRAPPSGRIEFLERRGERELVSMSRATLLRRAGAPSRSMFPYFGQFARGFIQPLRPRSRGRLASMRYSASSVPELRHAADYSIGLRK